MDRPLGLAFLGLVVTVVVMGVILWTASIFVLWGGSIGVAILLGLLYIPAFPVRSVRASPDQTLAYLGYRFTLDGHRVAGEPGALKVHMGRFTVTRILVRPASQGSQVLYQPYMSHWGWGWVLLLVLTMWVSVLGIPLVLVTFLRSRRFALGRLPALFTPDGAIPETFHPDDIRVLLLDGLAHGHRLATEAHEAVRDTYWDIQGVVLLGAILAWFLLFLAFFIASSAADFGPRAQEAALLATGGTGALAIPSAWIVYRMYQKRIANLLEWKTRLGHALTREAAETGPETGSPSTFDLLADSSRQIPEWLDATRRAGVTRDPASWSLLFIMATFAIELFFWIVPALASGEPLIALVALGLGILLSVGVYVFYRRWKEKLEARISEELASWSRRFEEVRSRMERFLQDL